MLHAVCLTGFPWLLRDAGIQADARCAMNGSTLPAAVRCSCLEPWLIRLLVCIPLQVQQGLWWFVSTSCPSAAYIPHQPAPPDDHLCSCRVHQASLEGLLGQFTQAAEACGCHLNPGTVARKACTMPGSPPASAARCSRAAQGRRRRWREGGAAGSSRSSN